MSLVDPSSASSTQNTKKDNKFERTAGVTPVAKVSKHKWFLVGSPAGDLKQSGALGYDDTKQLIQWLILKN